MLRLLSLILLGALLMSGNAEAQTNAVAKPVSKKIAVIGHRGASEAAPENTLASFALAAKVKADWAELDVQLSKDGEVIVCHDSKVDRTSNGKGAIKDLTLAELKKLDAGTWKDPKYSGERFPTLREALDLCRRDHIGLYIEIKDISEKKDRALEQQLIKLAGKRTLKDAACASEVLKAIEAAASPNLELTRKTIALVRQAGLQKQVVIQSFAPVTCAVTRIEAPELRDEYLGSRNEKKPKDWQTFLRFDKILDVKCAIFRTNRSRLNWFSVFTRKAGRSPSGPSIRKTI
jgi:glycerophosphoryl diester phosphodiesterase